MTTTITRNGKTLPLTPKGGHRGGDVGVYNIVRTDKTTNEKTTLESNLHSDQVDVERRAFALWKLPENGFPRYYVDTELVGYFSYAALTAPPKPCCLCGK